MRSERCITLFIALVTLALFCSLPVSAGPAGTGIKIESCFVLGFGHGDEESTANGMIVRFENTTNTTLRRIVWRASTPAGTIDFTDVGVFSPGLSIQNVLARHGLKFASRMNHATMEVMGPGVCTAIEFRDETGNTTKEPAPTPVPFEIPPVPPDSAAPVPASIDNPTHDPIGIVSCAFSIVRGRAYGHVRFRNLSSQTIDRIRFRAFYGNGGIDFVKAGEFAPRILVDTNDMSRSDLPPNAYSEYVTLDAPSSCAVVEAHFRGAGSWTNPTVGPTEPPFPNTP